LHGGAPGSGRPVVHGRYSRALNGRALGALFDEAAADPELQSLRNDLALADAMIVATLSELPTESHAAMWSAASRAFEALARATAPEDAKFRMRELRAILQNGAGAEAREERLLELQAHKARLQEAEARLVSARGNAIDARRMQYILAVVADILIRYVTVPSDRTRAVEELRGRVLG